MKRILSLLLCVVMVISLIPATIFAAEVISATTTNSNTEDGVSLKKTAVYNPSTGEMEITLEAFTTGTVRSTSRVVPTDIVLVLDVSGSMNATRMSSMKTAVKNFIDSTKTLNDSVQSDTDKHSIAVVKFATNGFYNSNNPLAVGNHKNNSGYNYSEVISAFTAVSADGASALKNSVDSLTAGGATAADYGLDLAQRLLEARDDENNGAYSERNKVVIFFADGEPNYYSGYDEEVAYKAVNFAANIKSAGAKIFTIGIFDDADHTDTTSNANKFMNYISSNYPLAYGSASQNWWNTSYSINPGAEPHYDTYYHDADTNRLNSVFQTIAGEVGHPEIVLGSSATLVDVVSDYFTVEGIGSNPEISVFTADYKGGADFNNAANWNAPVAATAPITATLGGDNDTVYVSGFDYDSNYVSATARDGKFGKKLIVKIVAMPNYDAIDAAAAAGTIVNGQIPTNDTAALLDSTSVNAAWTAAPILQANTVTYVVSEEGSERTIGTYYRYPGADITVNEKPADTAKYTYSDWTTTDVTVNAGGFTMPSGNVILKSTAAVREYTVSYEYRGAVPANTNPATAPATETYAVDADVTLAGVTAPAGYAFSGWVEDDLDVPQGTTTFTMPTDNLHFVGSFTALPCAYKVEHYLMDTEGNYPQTATYENTYNTASTGDTVNATAATHVGFAYDVVKTTEVNGAANMITVDGVSVPKGTVSATTELVLKLYYSRNKHQVSYEYVGTVPGGANPTTAGLSAYTAEYYYGEEVEVKGNASAPGYSFSGWTIRTGATAIEGGKMVMPDSDVVLRGSFTANGGTVYTVKHYFEKETSTDKTNKANYALDDSKTQTLNGVTDSTATAAPLSGADLVGFGYEASISSATGTINGSGTLVLELYYSRTRHTVTYQYLGTVPGDASALPTVAEYKYGDDVTVATNATATGYTFSGWSTDDVTVSSGKFEMPAKSVVVSGYFTPAANKYVVKHFMMDTNGDYPADTDHVHTYTNVKTGDTVMATVSEHIGFDFDQAETMAVGNQPAGVTFVTDGGYMVPQAVVATDGSTVLNLYYSRKQHTVSYEYLFEAPGASALPADEQFYYEEEVPVASDATAPGYTFSGWSIRTGDTAIENGKMIMPNSDVVLRGTFVATGDTAYTVEHYFESLSGGYDKDDAKTQTLQGAAGTEAIAVPLSGADIVGFSFNATMSENTRKGTIDAINPLVLKLYYDRTDHQVKYQYTGFVPGDATALPAAENHLFEQIVTRAANATADGYSFSGWTPNVTLSINADGEFSMPAAEVIFTGHFEPLPNKYTVEHYLMDTEGNYPTTASHSYVIENVKTGDAVSASTDVTHAGFYYDAAAANVLTGNVLPNGALTLKVYFARQKYTVSYEYEGTVPAGASALPDSAEYYFEEEVTVAPNATAQGYIFTGWSIHTGDTAIENGKMKMPAHGVILHGAFNADPNTKYTVKHYFEKADSTDADDKANYELDAGKNQTLTGATGATATAMPLSGADITGFSFNETLSATDRVGTILADGSLELELYYKRLESPVIYEYTGTVPAGVPAVPATVNHKYGTEVEVEENPEFTGYTFSGWQPWDTSVVSVNGGKFSMPARTVTFYGSFSANPSKYTVNHFLMNADGTYPAQPTNSVEFGTNVHVDDVVTAVPLTSLVAYAYDEAETRNRIQSGITMAETAGVDAPSGTVNAAGTLVLNLYYSRNLYDLTYAFTGTVPDGAIKPTDVPNVRHGTVLTLGSATVPAGYTFDGWYLGTEKLSSGTLTMPAADTTVTGSFAPRSDVKYKVEYYLQELDGTYTEQVADSFETTGTTGAYVVGPRIDYPGYTFNITASAWNGHVKGDGSLVLKLYYDRNVHTVTYYYYGEPPVNVAMTQNGVTVTPDADTHQIGVTETYMVGESFSVNHTLATDDPTYSFRGWYTLNISGVHANTENSFGTTMTMPDHDVVFLGTMFNYVVNYDLDGGMLNGSDTVAPKIVGWEYDNLLADGTPQKSGMRFVGWTYEDADVTAADRYCDLAENYTVLSVVLKAKYEPAGGGGYVTNNGSVKLTKTDAVDANTFLPGAVFDLYRGEQKYGTYTTDANGQILVTGLPAGTYSFVEVGAPAGYTLDDTKHEFAVEIGNRTELTVTNTKTPVPSAFGTDHFAYIIGYEDGTVRPDANITRAEVAVIFFRLLDDSIREQFMTKENTFTDVEKDMWFNTAVSTMAAMGVVSGYPDGTFRPNDSITRAEFAAIAAHFDESGNNSHASFTDIYDNWAHKEIDTAAGNGWILGYEDGTFQPQQLITRAEAMTMVNRVLQRIPQTSADLLDTMIKWPDNADTSKWYYLMVQEATNSHHYERKTNGYEKWAELRDVRDWTELEP